MTGVGAHSGDLIYEEVMPEPCKVCFKEEARVCCESCYTPLCPNCVTDCIDARLKDWVFFCNRGCAQSFRRIKRERYNSHLS